MRDSFPVVVCCSPALAAEAAREQLLALFSALAALTLRSAEEVGELGISVAVGVLDVDLEAESVAQARLGEPNQVVVLVLGAGDVPRLAVAAGHGAPPTRQMLTSGTTPWSAVQSASWRGSRPGVVLDASCVSRHRPVTTLKVRGRLTRRTRSTTVDPGGPRRWQT